MFEKITPEQAGFQSKDLVKLIKSFNDAGLNTHGIIMMKGDNVFFEAYYKPFNKDFLHRMYSQTKSYVGIAIGLLEEEGKLNLDDPIIKYFPEYIDFEPHPYLANQTIKHMLMMETSIQVNPIWFYNDDNDRIHLYFHSKPFRPSGLMWQYDSDGSEVLCALVEKLSGMSLLEYLKVKMFNDMGTFKNAMLLKVPGGYSWGDSALICTLRDAASFGRLVMNYGVYNGKRYINENYVKTATSNLTDNVENFDNEHRFYGYGYQIWHFEDNIFAFLGMGDQLTFLFKDYDVTISIHSSNQGNNFSRPFIYRTLKEFIYSMKESLAENKKDNEELNVLCDSLKMNHLPYGCESSLEEEINDVTYVIDNPNNDMKITEFSLHLEKDSGVFSYVNATGRKEIKFNRGSNLFTEFPEEGYSHLVGKEVTKGYFYKCANSGCWKSNKKFQIDVEVIDLYFGNLKIFLNFDGDYCYLRMAKNAENFFREYFGESLARKNNYEAQ